MPTYDITDPTTGQSVSLTGDSPPTEQELNDIFSQIGAAQPVAQTQQQAPRKTIGRAAKGQQFAETRRQTQDLTNKIEAGDISSKDLSDDQVKAVQKERIKRIPEISETGFKGLSENTNFLQALAATTTFDPDEFGAILTNADPDIGITTTPEGERIAVNNRTGDVVSINKLGPSLIDALQLGQAAAAFTPAGRLTTIPKIAGASALTQAAIEGGQAAAGGEFNPEQVALAGLAVPVVAGAVKGAQAAVNRLRASLAPSAIRAPVTPVSQGTTNAAPTPSAPLEMLPIDDVAQPSFTPLFGQQSKTKVAIRKAIEAGEGDNITAKYIIDGSNKVVKNKAAIDVIKQGKRTKSLDEGSVAAYVGSSNSDRAAMGKMLDVVEAGLKNKTFAAQNRPGKIVGNTLLKRFSFVKDINKKAGAEVGEAAKGLKEISVDTSKPVDNFFNSLDDLGVKIDANGKLDFSASSVTSSGETLLKKLLPKIKSMQETSNGFHAHNVKKSIQKNVTFGERKIEDPLDPDVANISKALMSEVNEILGVAAPKYKAANEVFSETIEAINNFRKASGKNFDIESPNVNEYVGKLARRLLSNVQSRETLMDSITGLEAVGRKHGGKFDDDIFTQILFVDDLEKTFGAFAQTGIQAEFAKGAATAARGSRTDLAVELLSVAAQKAQRLNEVNTLKSLRQLVRSR